MYITLTIFIILDAPVYEDPGVQNQTEGLNLTVKLELGANPSPQMYTWYKDGKPLANDSRVMFGVDYIKFSPAMREDSGIYTVKATNDIGSGNVTFEVDILCKLLEWQL